MSGTLFIINPDTSITEQRWEKSGTPDLEVFQKGVRGYIEHIKVRFNGRVRDAYCNEDGLSLDMSFNPAATALTRGTIFEGVTLVGPVVIWVPDPKKVAKPK